MWNHWVFIMQGKHSIQNSFLLSDMSFACLFTHTNAHTFSHFIFDFYFLPSEYSVDSIFLFFFWWAYIRQLEHTDRGPKCCNDKLKHLVACKSDTIHLLKHHEHCQRECVCVCLCVCMCVNFVVAKHQTILNATKREFEFRMPKIKWNSEFGKFKCRAWKCITLWLNWKFWTRTQRSSVNEASVQSNKCVAHDIATSFKIENIRGLFSISNWFGWTESVGG